MNLTVFSHKPCWFSRDSATSYATDGGFPYQMQALAGLFDSTKLVLPQLQRYQQSGEVHLNGKNLSIEPLTTLKGSGWRRKIRFPFWLLHNLPRLWFEARDADAIHAPIPGDIGTAGIFLALLMRKPLFVRHCGNWLAPRTIAERFWIWLMESMAGGKNVMLATGGQPDPPSNRNATIKWIFATSLTKRDLSKLRTQRSGPSNISPRLIITCRQEPDKGTDVVIAALPILRQCFSGITLDVVGDGSALAASKKLASDLGVTDSIRFHGRVNHERVLELMHSADLFCYPTSASEGFPKVVLEALACGLPVVTTHVSVLPYLIGSDCGVLIETASSDLVAKAVELCLLDRERYAHMSSSATMRANQYSLETWAQEIGGHLREAWGTLSSYE